VTFFDKCFYLLIHQQNQLVAREFFDAGCFKEEVRLNLDIPSQFLIEGFQIALKNLAKLLLWIEGGQKRFPCQGK